MTLEEQKTILDGLKARFDAPYSLEDRNIIRELYALDKGYEMKVTTCQSCYHDAVIELYNYVKIALMNKERKYRLRCGFIISRNDFHNAKVFDNNNITDTIAREYLDRFPDMEKYFIINKDVEDPQVEVKTKRGKKQ